MIVVTFIMRDKIVDCGIEPNFDDLFSLENSKEFYKMPRNQCLFFYILLGNMFEIICNEC